MSNRDMRSRQVRSVIERANYDARARPVTLPSLRSCYGGQTVTYLEGRLRIEAETSSVNKNSSLDRR